MRVGGWVVAMVLLLIVGGAVWRDYRVSQIFGRDYRFSLVMANPEGAVSFVSFDPVERRIFTLPFPSKLSIRSRSVGEYSVGSLYKLGEYKGEGGAMVRRKVQGFMRVPVPGYLIVESPELSQNALRWGLLSSWWRGRANTNLSRLDALKLTVQAWQFTWKEAGEEELSRAGVLEDKGGSYAYRPERLQEYVGTRLFDWGIGAEGVTIAVVNESGIDGMGSDMADFINNLGFDVVSVKTGTETKEVSSLLVADRQIYEEISSIFQRLLGINSLEQGEVESYRAQIVVRVGKDALELF